MLRWITVSRGSLHHGYTIHKGILPDAQNEKEGEIKGEWGNGEAETQVPSAPNGEAETQEWFCVFMYLRCQVSAVGLGVFRFSVHTGLVAPQPVRSWFPGQGWNPRPPHCRVAVNRGATRGVPRDESADQQCTLIAWRPNKNSHCDTGGLGWAPRCYISNKLPGGFPRRRSFLSVSGVHADPAPGASAHQASSSGRIASAGLPPPAPLRRPLALSPSTLSARPGALGAGLVLRF